jgi:hypothetical protein
MHPAPAIPAFAALICCDRASTAIDTSSSLEIVTKSPSSSWYFIRKGPSLATFEHTESLCRTFCRRREYVTSEGTTMTNMSFPYVILTLRADALSMVDPGVEGTGLRVEVEEDADEGVSGIEEKALVNVDVPVVGRDELIGDEGECGVIGESESRSLRPAMGSGGGNSDLLREMFVCI